MTARPSISIAPLLFKLLACALPALVLTTPAHAADGSVRETLRDDAREQFDQATRLYQAAEITAARDAFLAVYAQSGDPRVLYNVAVCDKALGRYARAIGTLRSSLSPARAEPLPADYVVRAKDSIAALSRYVAFATLRASVDDAAFAIDGETVLLRDIPAALEPGQHTISATKEGYDKATTTVQVKAGDAIDVLLTLVKSPQPSAATIARLRVTTDHLGDAITVDDNRAVTSGRDIELPAGEHRVVVARPDGSSKTMDIVLRPNETRDLRIGFGDERKSSSAGVSPWWFVLGGSVLAAGAAVGVFFATRPTTFEGSSAGTLNPYVVPASGTVGVFR